MKYETSKAKTLHVCRNTPHRKPQRNWPPLHPRCKEEHFASTTVHYSSAPLETEMTSVIKLAKSSYGLYSIGNKNVPTQQLVLSGCRKHFEQTALLQPQLHISATSNCTHSPLGTQKMMVRYYDS